MRRIHYGMLILLGITLTACSREDQMAKLHAFVDQGPSLHPKIQALPPLPHYSPTVYVNPLHRDPFTSFSELALQQEAANANQGPKPVHKGPLLPLEKYSLGSLTLTGIVQADGRYWGVFLTPDGKVYRAGIGDGIGDKDGKIVRIDPQKHVITVEQYLPNAFGGYQKQNTTLQFPSNG